MRCILVLFLLHGQFSSLLLSLLNALKEILSLFTLGWPLSLRWRYNDDEVAIFGRTFYISSKKLDTRIQCWHYSDGIAKAVTNDWLKVKIDRIYRLTKTNDWPTCQDFSIETRGGFCVFVQESNSPGRRLHLLLTQIPIYPPLPNTNEKVYTNSNTDIKANTN